MAIKGMLRRSEPGALIAIVLGAGFVIPASINTLNSLHCKSSAWRRSKRLHSNLECNPNWIYDTISMLMTVFMFHGE